MTIEPPNECMTAAAAQALLLQGANCQVASDLSPHFQVGDLVRAKVMHPKTYTRLPRYVRGKVGTVVRAHGVYVFPDTLGQRLSTSPQHVYNIRFAAQELWGPEAATQDALYLDLFDAHLEVP